jgi:UDP-N-acetyl-D-mannosaminuronic acid dehydrogenase
MRAFERICVVGLGYIGLPTAAILASRKVQVIGVDVNQTAVDTINQGKIHIVEPDLDIIVSSTVNEGYLRATTVPEVADAFLIAVPTPFTGENHDPDLSYIKAACRSIAPVLKAGDLVILESTSPVGATEKMSEWLADVRSDLVFPHQSAASHDISIAHCPERVLPGKVLEELIHNDRVIGGVTPQCAERAAALYRIFVEGDCLLTTARTAEMAKLTENSFRDVNIAFANELSLICDRLSIDVWELIALANRHPRVNILQPGPGVGGHCIAVDPWFIVSSTPDLAHIVRTAREVNDAKPHWVIGKIDAALSNLAALSDAEVPTVVCYGLAFKPDIDDLRESPALEIATTLAARSELRLKVVEPNIKILPAQLNNAELVEIGSLDGSEQIHVLLVDHRQFKTLTRPAGIVIDTRGVWSASNQ